MRRYGWPIFVLILCTATGGYSSDRNSTTRDRAHEVREDPRHAVQRILAADMTPEARMAALEPYINVGDATKKVEKLLDKPTSIWIHGGGAAVIDYGNPDKHYLIISCDQDGKVAEIRYKKPNEKSVRLPKPRPSASKSP